jgi:hypothetical protein
VCESMCARAFVDVWGVCVCVGGGGNVDVGLPFVMSLLAMSVWVALCRV